MSAKIMGKTWELDLPANKMLVLLAMGDHADHNGDNIYPGMALIAYKTGYSERQVKRIVAALVKDGILIEHGGRSKLGTKMYSINVDAGKHKPAYEPAKRSDKMSHSQSDKMSLHEKDNEVTNGAQRSDISTPIESDILSTQSDIAVSTNPSLEPSKEEPSLEPPIKDSEPSGSGAPASVIEKPRNELFDAVAKHIFEIAPEQMPGEVQEQGGRIGPISSWLNGKSDGIRRKGKKETVGKISRPAEPEHVRRFAEYWKRCNPTANLPLDFVKFVEAWRKWASAAADSNDGSRYITGKHTDTLMNNWSEEELAAWREGRHQEWLEGEMDKPLVEAAPVAKETR